MYERDSLAHDTTVKEKNIDYLQENMKYSEFSLAGEVARYLNISCILAARILRESVDGIETVLDVVNRYNAVLDDYIIPAVFHALFDITSELKTEDKELVLLREPKDAGYYAFSARDDLVLTNRYPGFTSEQLKKSFHADTYCFDSIPENHEWQGCRGVFYGYVHIEPRRSFCSLLRSRVWQNSSVLSGLSCKDGGWHLSVN